MTQIIDNTHIALGLLAQANKNHFVLVREETKHQKVFKSNRLERALNHDEFFQTLAWHGIDIPSRKALVYLIYKLILVVWDGGARIEVKDAAELNISLNFETLASKHRFLRSELFHTNFGA